MIEWLIQAALTGVAVLAALYILGDLYGRLSPKFEIKHGGFPRSEFGVWADLIDFGVEELRVGFVDEWELGPVVKTTCEGTVTIGGETSEDRRVYISFYGFRDAYKRTNIIGWASDRNETIDIRLSIGPDEVRDVLNEMRLSSNLSLHVHGWKDDKNIKIEHFTLSPKLWGD